MKPCLSCGEPSEETRCPDHQRPDERGTPAERGYDWTWQKLSKRARALQPWCSDCFTTDDLTTDHSPQAWARKAAGKAIRLRDVDVVCRSCNAKRGRAKPLETQGTGPLESGSTPVGKAQSPLHTRTVLK